VLGAGDKVVDLVRVGSDIVQLLKRFSGWKNNRCGPNSSPALLCRAVLQAGIFSM
jgi:hypothetical protein